MNSCYTPNLPPMEHQDKAVQLMLDSDYVNFDDQGLGKCKQAYEPTPKMLKDAGLKTAKKFYHPKGCDTCRNTGYAGRVGVFEILTLDEELKDMIAKGSNADEIKRVAVSKGMKTLFDSALDKVQKGLTSLEEAYTMTYVM